MFFQFVLNLWFEIDLFGSSILMWIRKIYVKFESKENVEAKNPICDWQDCVNCLYYFTEIQFFAAILLRPDQIFTATGRDLLHSLMYSIFIWILSYQWYLEWYIVRYKYQGTETNRRIVNKFLKKDSFMLTGHNTKEMAL